MTRPTVIELQRRLEPVSRGTFFSIDHCTARAVRTSDRGSRRHAGGRTLLTTDKSMHADAAQRGPNPAEPDLDVRAMSASGRGYRPACSRFPVRPSPRIAATPTLRWPRADERKDA